MRSQLTTLPGPSGDLVPDVRMDLMSPMQLEMLARGEIEGMENVG